MSWEMSETNHDEKFYFTHRLAGLDLDLPIGYYFVPTDIELVKDYLVPKTLGEPQPAGFVHDADAQDIYDPSLNHQLLDIQGGELLFLSFICLRLPTMQGIGEDIFTSACKEYMYILNL